MKSNELSLTSWQCLSNERVLDREANVERERERGNPICVGRDWVWLVSNLIAEANILPWRDKARLSSQGPADQSENSTGQSEAQGLRLLRTGTNTAKIRSNIRPEPELFIMIHLWWHALPLARDISSNTQISLIKKGKTSWFIQLLIQSSLRTHPSIF